MTDIYASKRTVYFVTQAPVQPGGPDGDVFYNHQADLEPDAFDSKDEAIKYAEFIARRLPGVPVWVVEGRPIQSMIVEPSPVQITDLQ